MEQLMEMRLGQQGQADLVTDGGDHPSQCHMLYTPVAQVVRDFIEEIKQ